MGQDMLITVAVVLLGLGLPIVNIVSVVALNHALVENGYSPLPATTNGFSWGRAREQYALLWMCLRSNIKPLRFWSWVSLTVFVLSLGLGALLMTQLSHALHAAQISRPRQ